MSFDLSGHTERVEGSQGEWAGPGDHLATVKSFRRFGHNDSGLEYTCETDSDGKAKTQGWFLRTKDGKPNSFWLSRLGSFAKACGCTEDELANFDFETIIGKTVCIRVVPDGKYHVIADGGWWDAVDGECPLGEMDPAPSTDGTSDALPF